MSASDPTPDTHRVTWLLIAMNVVSIGIGYGLSILLARNLSHDGFEQYVGAVATLSVLATLAEGGTGKFGLKVIPIFVANGDGGLVAGYLRFAIFTLLGMSMLLGLLAAGIELPLRSGSDERTIILAILFLPVIAGVGVAVDTLLAFRMAVIGTFVARILVPTGTLSFVVVSLATGTLTPLRAVLYFCAGSAIGFFTSAALCYGKAKPLVSRAKPKMMFGNWIANGLSFMTLGFLTSWMFRATLVLTFHLPHEGDELALLAPAFETGCLILLLSKSTDKYFQPTVSLILESGNSHQANLLRRQRFVTIGLGIAVFLVVVLVFGKRILRLYGPGFDDAFPELCLVAFGSSVWTLFSLAPTILQFSGQQKTVLVLMAAHGVLIAVLTVILFRYLGGTGAAIAYAVAISSLAISNRVLALRRLRRLPSPADEPFGQSR